VTDDKSQDRKSAQRTDQRGNVFRIPVFGHGGLFSGQESERFRQLDDGPESGGDLSRDEKPQFEWESPLAAMEAAQKHEAYITGRINSLVDLAIKEKDHATASFLGWFVDEQVEEEDSVNEVVQKLRLLGSDGGGLFMMDRDMATRVFTPPVA
jgi:hypothetical protein